MNRKNFLKLISLFPVFLSLGFKSSKYPRYIYAKEQFDYFCAVAPKPSFGCYVMGIDLKEMCGFTPQDWNITWMPDENWKEVSWDEFHNISKDLKSITTHFRNLPMDKYYEQFRRNNK